MNSKIIKKGFNPILEELCAKSRFLRSCSNCNYFYSNSGEELCNNPNVTAYDLVVSGNDSYCAYWSVYKQPKKAEETKKSLDDILLRARLRK